MPKLVILDFETYYDQEYSLSKMTTQDYILDPRAEEIICTLKIDDGPVQVAVGRDAIDALLPQQDWWDDAVLVAHNTMFDGGWLYRRFKRLPKMLCCTMSMARALGWDIGIGASLGALSKTLRSLGHDIPEKGDEVVLAKGKRLGDFGEYDLKRYISYCKTDTEICYRMFNLMHPHLTAAELKWQDSVLRMAVTPKFKFDKDILLAEQKRVQTRISTMMQKIQNGLGAASEEEVLKKLRSSIQFKNILEHFGGVLPREYFNTQEEFDAYMVGRDAQFTIPVKKSLRTNKWTTAFSKTDPGVLALLEFGSETIQDLFAAKLGANSNGTLSRIELFLKLAEHDAVGIPLNVSGAHTHRLTGGEKLNFQNLSSGRVEGQTSALRNSLVAPEGYVVIAADSSQVEARVTAYVAQQNDVLDAFAANTDLYCKMASVIYDVPEEDIFKNYENIKEYKTMRQCGKAAMLGCQYQMGADRFKDAAKMMYGVEVSEELAQQAVRAYRQRNQKIVEFWNKCASAIQGMLRGKSGHFGGVNDDLLFFQGDRSINGVRTPGVRLPDGMWLNYRNLRVEEVFNEEKQKMDKKFVYDFWDRRKNKLVKKNIYGGALTENIVQALAFAAMKWQARQINKYYPVLLNVHDEWATVVKEDEVELATHYIEACMKATPKWLQGCPLNCKVGSHKSYGEC